MTDRRNRRSVLASIVTASTVAGCLDRLGGANDGDDIEGRDHPAIEDAGSLPTRGPEPQSAPAIVVEFSDPSCPQCAAFAEETFPKLRAESIESGDLSYLWRAQPIVAEWGRVATGALFAVYERDPTAFWWLKSRYYGAQSSLAADTVLDRTADFLAERDEIDAEDVLASVEDRSYQQRLADDVRAAEASDVSSVPSFVLFREEYVTTVVGPQPYEVFEGALEL